jgi:hypothetical protein
VKAWALAAASGETRAALLLVAEVVTGWDYEAALEEAAEWEGE